MKSNKFCSSKTLVSRITNSEIGSRIVKGAFWTFTGTALGKLLILISGIFCARILGQIQYAELGILRSTINMFVVFGSTGIGLAATKYISEFRSKSNCKIVSIYKVSYLFSLTIGFILTFIVFEGAELLAENTLNATHLTDEIRISSIILFFTIMNGIQNGILSGYEDFKQIAINTFWSSLIEGVAVVIGAYYCGVYGALLGFGLGFIVCYIMNEKSIRKHINNNYQVLLKTKINKEDVIFILKYSIPATLSSLLVVPTYWLSKIFLVNYAGYTQLSIFEAADQFKVVILFIPGAISRIVLPILSNIYNPNNKDLFNKTLRTNIYLNVGTASVIGMIVILFSDYLMNLYGKGFDDNLTLIFLALSTIFSSLAGVVGSAIYSRAKMWPSFFWNLFWSFLFLSFSYISIIWGYGARGVAFSLLASYFFHSLFQMIYLKYIINHE